MIALSPLPHITPLNSKKISTNELLIFAILSDEDDFSQTDINLTFSKLLTKYRVERKTDFDIYLQGVSTYSDSSVSYLGHFAFFLIVWLIAHYISVSGNSWFTISNSLFWKGFFWFSIALLWTWIRMINLLEIYTITTIKAVIYFAQMDKDFTKKLEDISSENYKKRRQILAQIKKMKTEAATAKPSLYRYLRYRFSQRKSKSGSKPDKKIEPHISIRNKYMATRGLYDRGHAFRINKSLSSRYDDSEWLSNYIAYVYYKKYKFVKIRVLALVSLLKFWLFGKA